MIMTVVHWTNRNIISHIPLVVILLSELAWRSQTVKENTPFIEYALFCKTYNIVYFIFILSKYMHNNLLHDKKLLKQRFSKNMFSERRKSEKIGRLDNVIIVRVIS